METTVTWGVFSWNADNRYPVDAALKVYKRRSDAMRRASALNKRAEAEAPVGLPAAGGYVVRELPPPEPQTWKGCSWCSCADHEDEKCPDLRFSPTEFACHFLAMRQHYYRRSDKYLNQHRGVIDVLGHVRKSLTAQQVRDIEAHRDHLWAAMMRASQLANLVSSIEQGTVRHEAT